MIIYICDKFYKGNVLLYEYNKMVKEVTKKDKTYYQCEACGFYYKTRELAEKCEKWCKETNSCNIEIIKQAIQLD